MQKDTPVGAAPQLHLISHDVVQGTCPGLESFHLELPPGLLKRSPKKSGYKKMQLVLFQNDQCNDTVIALHFTSLQLWI